MLPTREESYQEICKKGLSIKPIIVWFEIDSQNTQQNIINRRSENIEPTFDDILLSAFVIKENKKESEWKCPIKEAKYGVVFSNQDDHKETFEMTQVARRQLREITASYESLWKDIEKSREEMIQETLKEEIDRFFPRYKRHSFIDYYESSVYQRVFCSNIIMIEASIVQDKININWIWKGGSYATLQHVLYELQNNIEMIRLMVQ